MDPKAFRSTFSNLALGSAMSAAARDYKAELLSTKKEKAPAAPEVDLDDLIDDPELERLHSERILSLKKEAEKRQALQRKGHGEYREVTEEDFLGEVTGSERVVCHFYHQEFVRCKIINKHLIALAPKHLEAKFIMVDAEKCPFFVTKLQVKMLPCLVLFKNGVGFDRIVGFQEMGNTDDFPTKVLERLLIKKGALISLEKKLDDGETVRSVRSTTYESDSE